MERRKKPSANVTTNSEDLRTTKDSNQKRRNFSDSAQNSEDFLPSINTIIFLFLSVRTLSTLVSVSFITDVDEVMNYWEPTHYLTFGYGFQTWEYSPTYALRSYAYIGLHAIIASIAGLLTADKITIFYSVRLFLAFICASCETFFVLSVFRRFGTRVGLFNMIFLYFSPGMFFAGTNYLPSTFSMYALIVAFGAWFNHEYQLAVMSVAFSTILGWPFSVLLALPLAFDAIRQRGLVRVIYWGILSLLFFLGPVVLVDYYFYRKLVVAPLNIILYNVFSDLGPNLYGTEPWYFYLINAFLNFNIAFILALISAPLVIIYHYISSKSSAISTIILLYLSSFYIWFIFMSRMPHKEERFLFVIYHLICFGASVSLAIGTDLLSMFLRKVLPSSIKIPRIQNYMVALVWLVFIVFIGSSVSRILSFSINYSAPVTVYSHLYEVELGGGKQYEGRMNVCVGKEWYRFPSNFFLPSSNYTLCFLESGFKGQLPKPYDRGLNGTYIIPADMNDENREEISRYTPVHKCHYIVDVEFEHQVEPMYSSLSGWETIFEAPFLDASRSHPLFRAFYIPVYSPKYTKFNNYRLLKNTNLVPS